MLVSEALKRAVTHSVVASFCRLGIMSSPSARSACLKRFIEIEGLGHVPFILKSITGIPNL